MQFTDETLRSLGCWVALNVPVRGAEPVSAYSDPAHGRHSLQIEINRRFYMNEDSRERSAGFEALRGIWRRWGGCCGSMRWAGVEAT